MAGRYERNSERRTTDREDPRRGDARAPAPRRPPPLNDYWIDGEGIDREVLQIEICKYLGAEATCRPGDYNGIQGYRIKALRPFTPQMLEDLKIASQDYRSENRAARYQGHEGSPSQTVGSVKAPNAKTGTPYIHSQARRSLNDPSTAASDPRYQPALDYPGINPYLSGPGYVPSSTYPTETSYPGYAITTGPGSGQSAAYAGIADPRYPNYPQPYSQPGPSDYGQSYPGYGTPSVYGEPSQPRNDMSGYTYPTTGPNIPGRSAPADDQYPREYYESQLQPGGRRQDVYPPSRAQQSSPYDQIPGYRQEPPRESYRRR